MNISEKINLEIEPPAGAVLECVICNEELVREDAEKIFLENVETNNEDDAARIVIGWKCVCSGKCHAAYKLDDTR